MSITDGNILLDTGTNELEVLEFTVSGNSFGINVSKVTELMQAIPVQPMPHSHPCVEGIVQPRDTTYTIVDLPKYLDLPPVEALGKDIYIIAHMNMVSIGFHVHRVEGIHRLSWEQIEKPDSLIYGGKEGIITGTFKLGDKIVSILDFEKITYDLSPETGFKMNEVVQSDSSLRANRPILIAEDSTLLRKLIIQALKTSGYTHLITTTNGQEAWNILQGFKEANPHDLYDEVACVITDIEMPMMDGHRLTRLIKEDSVLRRLPVLVFSSLIDDNMRKKGLEVGADAQVSKPEIGQLVETLDQVIGEYTQAVRS